MKKWPKSYPCHARRDSENGNGALVKQTFASEQIRVPNYIPQGELSQCLLFLCLLWNHTGGRGELFQASEMSAILIVLRPTASVLTDFAVLASIFDWRSTLKKKNKEIRLARLRASYRYSIRTSLWDQGLSWFVQIWGGKLHLLHSWRAHWEFPCRWLCHSVPSCMFCSSLNSFDNFYMDFLRSSGLS